MNAAADIRDLNTVCGVGETSLDDNCDYTEYQGIQEAFCAGENSINIFNADCENGKHGEVTLARETECRRTTATPDVIDRATECLTIRARLCTADEFALNLDDGYLCGNENVKGTNYETTREGLCASRPSSSEPHYANCNTFLNTLCTGKEFGTAGLTDGYNCAGDGEFDSKREERCGTDGMGSGDDPLTNGECTATIVRICVGDKTLSDSVGDGGYDCAANQTNPVLYQRQDFCATSATTEGCPDVLATLCMKGDHSVRTDVPTNVSSNVYSCAGNTTGEVILARQTYCGSTDNVLCASTITGFCGESNDNPTRTNNLFNPLCRVGYDGARDKACLAADAMTGGAGQ